MLNLVKTLMKLTVHFPSGKEMAIFDAAMEYKKAGH